MAILDKLFCSLFVWLAVLALIATASPDFVASTSVSNTSNSTNLTSFTKSVIRPTPLGMNFTCDDAHVDDKHYFHFTAENFYCSNVVEWYANWTIQKQTSPEWKELGEWKSFGSDFLQDYNLNCGAALATCHDTATRWELQRMYPGPENLERVRRIFFVLNMYNLFHEYESSMEVCSPATLQITPFYCSCSDFLCRKALNKCISG
jgi:hypothetical protein